MKMGRRLREVGEASSLCPPGRSKARRFAYALLLGEFMRIVVGLSKSSSESWTSATRRVGAVGPR
jgi:hypothetical protein